MTKKHVRVGDIDCGSDRMFLIAGPCVIEAEPLMMRTAERLKKIAANLEIELDFYCVTSKHRLISAWLIREICAERRLARDAVEALAA